MTHQPPSSTEEIAWDACPQGEIQGMVKSLELQRKNRRLQNAAFIGGAMMVLLAVGMWLEPQFAGEPKEPNFGGIVCSKVQENLQAYLAKTIDPSLAEKIQLHLAECPHCQEKLEMMQPKPMSVTVSLPNSRDFQLARRLENIDWSNSFVLR